MEKLLLNKADAERMGKSSRNLAEKTFDVKIVNKKIISLVNR